MLFPGSSGRYAQRLALALLLGTWPSLAQAAATEGEIKAAYLYKLASFVRWPEGVDSSSKFTICVASRSDVARLLEKLADGQQVGGRAVMVEQLTSAQAARVKECQLLFVGRGNADALFKAAHGLPVLTVGDRNSGARGGVVDFLFRDGRVRLVIDRGAADTQHLELSSKLLDVAVTVTP
jgi:hypothetical protein